MKTSNFASYIRTLLGLFLVFYGLNKFIHIVDTSYSDMPYQAEYFLNAVAPYLPALYIFEIILGALLLLNFATPLMVALLTPLTVNFLIFNIANDISYILPALIVAILNFYLIWYHREKFIPLLKS